MGMIDVGKKRVTKRTAKAKAVVRTGKDIIRRIKENRIAKGDVLEHARISGIMAAKKTSDIIPLCHPLPLDHVEVSFEVFKDSVVVNTMVTARTRTGVEMEAMTAASCAALTIYDLCKMYGKGIEIKDVCLLYKSGGRTGVFKRKD
ncbi:MAG: cyclic pyranopterin monophosphate synthase MoaC [Candidatus Omnitrophica bacterium]|nr:cyclic pyranopterin monophosphate synthase MoaC [Candidatus Omnitrophota bacterium]MBU1127812.1 cyclic pyranopterin monophosphate synthase MoaC [Candidatus Omnitrophota bacterium]MBU1784548.1 cyclic pyranopterin monophosphate synthase MoaC [Candidatus Omnitrophota bacterium]MBU1851148.1 cyclic pyranopterin monophosphate synthase MoaC [Candidatus Omnitrophota bacterium]